VEHPDRELLEAVALGEEDGARGFGVSVGAVAEGEVDAEVVGDAAKAVVTQAGQEELGKIECVVDGAGEVYATAGEKRRVELDALADDGAIGYEVSDFGGDGREVWGLAEVFDVNAGETLDGERREFRGADEGAVLAEDGFAIEGDGGDLDDLVGFRVETGGLGIEGDVAGHRASVQGLVVVEQMTESYQGRGIRA
jgi:hypothetical protein